MNDEVRGVSAPLGINGRGGAAKPPDPREIFAGDANDFREALHRTEARAREIASAHPVPVLVGAFAVGYLLARLVRRGSS